jgi:hypothetical protein
VESGEWRVESGVESGEWRVESRERSREPEQKGTLVALLFPVFSSREDSEFFPQSRAAEHVLFCEAHDVCKLVLFVKSAC